jgi:hypothetical protein
MHDPHENAEVPGFTPEQVQDRWMWHMRRGEWESAWRISDEELRLRRAGLRGSTQLCPRHRQVIWDGAPLEGKKVLVRCYHGMGDTVQFIRFMPQLRRIAARTIVWAQPGLIPLLQTAGGIDELVPLHDAEPDIDRDVDIELMELPHALRMTLDTLPGQVPYFNLGAVSRSRRSRPAVGVVWQSGDWDARRSITPTLMAELLQLPGIDWQILQRGPALALRPPGTARVPEIHDILDEAKAMRGLDLLISVDTLSAHLGGALAVPTWTLIHTEADWRWMEARNDSPWYPTMRLFRQTEPGNWRGVIERVAQQLQLWKQQSRGAPGARVPR